jgi:peptide/nickel transport system substrate-binding protein
MKRYRKGVRLALLGLASAVVAGGVIGVTPVTADSTNFVVAVQKNPPTMEPMRENSNAQMRVLYNIGETLISIDFKHGFKLIPGLATEWKRLDNLTLEFKLRKGVKFHNGEEMTAEDVAFTFGPERFTGEKAPGWPVAKQYLGVIAGTEIIDDYTIRISSKTPDPLLEQRFANYMSEIISKKAYLDAGDWDKWSRNVVATGPYRLVEMKTGEYIKLEAFDGYWGEKAPVKTVTFKVVPEVAARIAGLTTGEYDIISEIPPDQLKGIDDAKGIEAAGGPIRNIRAINYDETNARLSDPRIRRALNLAIDRQLIVDALYHGRTVVPRGM